MLVIWIAKVLVDLLCDLEWRKIREEGFDAIYLEIDNFTLRQFHRNLTCVAKACEVALDGAARFGVGSLPASCRYLRLHLKRRRVLLEQRPLWSFSSRPVRCRWVLWIRCRWVRREVEIALNNLLYHYLRWQYKLTGHGTKNFWLIHFLIALGLSAKESGKYFVVLAQSLLGVKRVSFPEPSAVPMHHIPFQQITSWFP